MKRIGIYHSKDMDGICCGAIMKLKYPDITLIGFDYGENIWLKLMAAGFASEEKNEAEPPTCFPPDGFDGEVIMADVSLKRDEMFKLAEWCGNRFTWIDHHKSAIEDVCGAISPGYRRYGLINPANEKVNINVYVEVGPAACELCWDYLIKNSRVHQDTPDVVQLLGEYDTWRNQDKDRWDNCIMPYQYGMRLICTGVDDFPMDLFGYAQPPVLPYMTPCPVTEKGLRILHDGRTVLKYQKQQNTRAAQFTAFEVEFEGLRAICMNNGGANSQLFESVYDEAKHDIMIPFVFTGKHWTFSIYSTKPDIDCSELAKKYGGGGHKGAAGFQVTDAHWFAETFLIFRKQERSVPFKDEPL